MDFENKSFKYTAVYPSIQVIKMGATTIKIHKDTKSQIDKFREYKNESYDEVLKKLIFIANNVNTELSRKTVKQIAEARERIRKGNFVTEKEAKQRLGL